MYQLSSMYMFTFLIVKTIETELSIYSNYSHYPITLNHYG